MKLKTDIGWDSPLSAINEEQRIRLEIYGTLLVKWQRHVNLVSKSTLAELWRRHFADSLQLLPVAGAWSEWVDVGSGAGFPGLVVAMTAPCSTCRVHLIEADKRKAAFLAEVSRETGVTVQIHADRLERVLPALTSTIHFDVISARALAPLGDLLKFSASVIEKGGRGLFLKGKELQSELTSLAARDSFNFEMVDSVTESGAKIVIVRSLKS